MECMQNRVVCLCIEEESCWLAHEQGSEAAGFEYEVEARGEREGERESYLNSNSQSNENRR